MLRGLRLNSRVCLNHRHFAGVPVGSFCHCGSPSTGTGLFLHDWTSRSPCSSWTCRGCWRTSRWRCSRRRWNKTASSGRGRGIFSLLSFLAPRVSVPQCLFYVRLVSSLVFFQPNFTFLAPFIVLYAFVLLATLAILHRRVFIVPHAYFFRACL